MESDAARQLEEVQRQRLEVYCSQSTPGWAWPVFGVGVFLFLSSYELRSAWVTMGAVVVWGVFVGLWLGMLQKRSGVQPRLRGMPRPLFRELVRFWLAGAAVTGVVVALGFAVSFVLAGVLAGVVTTVGGRYFDQRYRRRAEILLAGHREIAAT